MLKKRVVLAACVALLLVLVQTPDSFGSKLPPGFKDRTHIYFGNGWDQTAASVPSSSGFDSSQLKIVIFPWPGILKNYLWISIQPIAKSPKNPDSVRSGEGKQPGKKDHGITKNKRGLYAKKSPRRNR